MVLVGLYVFLFSWFYIDMSRKSGTFTAFYEKDKYQSCTVMVQGNSEYSLIPFESLLCIRIIFVMLR